METQQYYVPDITEFHIGFEYEILIDGVWLKTFITIETSLLQVKEQIKSKIIRVKYLDKKDICQLGWKETSKDCFQLKAKDYSLFLGKKHTCIMRFDDILFTGAIKNKLELKKIMQMLRISK